jgi:hypothetical protein
VRQTRRAIFNTRLVALVFCVLYQRSLPLSPPLARSAPEQRRWLILDGLVATRVDLLASASRLQLRKQPGCVARSIQFSKNQGSADPYLLNLSGFPRRLCRPRGARSGCCVRLADWLRLRFGGALQGNLLTLRRQSDPVNPFSFRR